MADAEFEARRLAELLEQANYQLAQFGEVTQRTQQELVDAQMKAKFGINNYTAVTRKAGETLGAVASAGISAGKAMLEGKKGAAALNSSLDDLAKAATIAGTALTLLMPGGIIIKGVVAAFTAVTAATIGSVKAANEMADKLYKGYSGLAKSGGAAADGMTGVFNNAKKLGLSMNELDGFVSLINENSSDLAQFSGSVAKGRQRLADMGDALRGSRQGFLAMGLSMQDVSEGMAGYMRLQARTGNIQERSARDSAAAAKEYIYQQDALAKITGISVKEQQKQREAALTEQMFLAQVRKLQSEGRHKEAKELQDLNILMNNMGEETGRAYRASVTGRLTDEAARKGLMSSNGEMQRSIEMVKNGQLTAAQAANRVGRSFSEVNARQGDQLALLGVQEQTGLKYHETVKGATMAQQDYEEQLREAEDQRKKQIAGADGITGRQAELMNRQISTNEKMERALFDLIPAAQDVMLTMQDGADMVADAFKRIVEAINELLDMFGFGKSKEAKAKEKKTDEAQAAYKKSMEGTGFLDRVGIGLGIKERTAEQQKAYEDYRKKEADYNIQRAQDRRERRERTGRAQEVDAISTAMQDIPMAAKGGLLSGPDSGYLAMLHGTEMVVPVAGTGQKIEELGTALAVSKMNDAVKNLGEEQARRLSMLSTGRDGSTAAAIKAMQSGNATALGASDQINLNYSEAVKKSMQAATAAGEMNRAVEDMLAKSKPAGAEGKNSAEKISGYIQEISSDLLQQTKTFDKDTKNIKKFGEFQENYQRKMTKYMQEVLDLCDDNNPEAVIGTAGGGGSVGGASAGGGGAAGGGGGILGRMMQAFSSIMGGGGGSAGAPGGPQPDMSAEGKSTGGGPEQPRVPSSGQQGKPRKKTEGVVYHHTGGRSASGAKATLEARGLAYHYMIDRDGSIIPYMPDNAVAYHAGNTDKNPKYGNWNTIGVATLANDDRDVTQEQIAAAISLNQQLATKYGFSSQDVFGHGGVSSQKMPTEGKTVTDAIKGGVRTTPEVPKYGDGGVVDKETFAMIGEKGPEAVIPLKDGAVPVSFSGSMSLPSEAMSLFQQMANQSAGMMSMMEEMVRAQRNSVDVQQKMLRNANS